LNWNDDKMADSNITNFQPSQQLLLIN